MSAAPLADTPAPAGARFDDHDAPLTLIERRLPDGFAAWLGGVSPDRWPDGRFLAHRDHVRAGLQALFKECGAPEDALAQWWIDDVVALAARFAARAGEDVVDIRLERVSNDACWRFHIDNVQLRLVTTYFGPGTEIVPKPFGQQARSLQQRYDGPVDRLPAGAVAIFHGGPGGVVHRSPPIVDSGEHRSLLCLNMRSMTSPPLWTPDAA